MSAGEAMRSAAHHAGTGFGSPYAFAAATLTMSVSIAASAMIATPIPEPSVTLDLMSEVMKKRPAMSAMTEASCPGVM